MKLLVVILMSSLAWAAEKADSKTTAPLQESAPAGVSSRFVAYHETDIVQVSAAMHYTTVIELPKGEKAIVGMCGDQDNWNLEKSENIIAITPLKAGAKTNVNIIAESGNTYTFDLEEVSPAHGKPDQKIFITLSGRKMLEASSGKPMFVSAESVDGYRKEAQAAKDALAAEQTKSAAKLAEVRQTAAAAAQENIKHDYEYDRKAAEKMGLKGIWRANGFTYFEVDSQETPALYETRDKQDTLIQYQQVNGRYEVSRVIDQGVLKIGKAKLAFKREKG